jgi:DNA polymerase I-like protein with 3'-5' exonuclease and polymerase domains
MNLITLDFETFYDNKLKLGFKYQTTEEYVRDSRFEVIGVGVKVDDAPEEWFSGSHEEISSYLNTFDWDQSALLCHNTLFDGCILSWHFGIKPAFLLDTLSMARALHGVDAGGSLAKLADRYMLGKKGDEVIAAEGKSRKDFTPTDLAQYGEYCKNDVDLTFRLFRELAGGFPEEELELIDMTLRMFTEPVFEVDDALLQERLADMQAEKSELLTGLMEKLKCDTEEAVRKKLSSNKQFAAILLEHGITPPMKISGTTGKETYALAKNDEGFLALTEMEDTFIQQLCAVRLGTKSTIEESRIERFIDIGMRNEGRLPIPLKYYGAHTGRWAGSDKVNFQNLPSRDKKKKALKNAVVAPEGHVVINCDSSQIEARILVWLAGQEDVVEQFRNGEDVYSIFASEVYNRPVSKANPTERFVGKTCIAYDSLVLTDRGLVPIQNITLEHKLWDGVEWVSHEGLIFQGIKNVITYQGLTATKDHGVFTERGAIPLGVAASRMEDLTRTGDGREAIRVCSDYFKRDTAPREEHLRVCEMFQLWSREVGTERELDSRCISGLSTVWTNKINLLRNTWQTLRRNYCAMQSKLESFLCSLWRKGYPVQLQFADGVYFVGGEKPAAPRLQGSGDRSYQQQRKLRAGEFEVSNPRRTGTQQTQYSKSFMAGETNTYGGISLSIRNRMDIQIGGKDGANRGANHRTVQVYDILNAGPRRRFTVNNILVLNCVLGLGYGTGALKLQHTLKTTPPGAVIDDEEAKRIVGVYRDKNDMVIKLWREGDKVIGDLAVWPEDEQGNPHKPYYYGKNHCLKVYKSGIRLPNGLMIRYPDLEKDTSEATTKYVYKSRKGPVSLWGGSLVENVVQALARIVVGQQMLKIKKRYPVKLTVHDAAVVVVPEAEQEEALAYVVECMSVPPDWCESLPVACEANVGRSYGDC